MPRRAGLRDPDQRRHRPGRWRAGGGGIAGYPLVLKPSEKTKTAFIFTPAATPAGAGGTLTVRF